MLDRGVRRLPVIVPLPAEIDFSNADQVYDRLYAAMVSGASVVVADFGSTRFCDCSGLGRLIRLRNRAAARSVQLRLAIPCGGPVRRVLELLSLGEALPVFASVNDAISFPESGEDPLGDQPSSAATAGPPGARPSRVARRRAERQAKRQALARGWCRRAGLRRRPAATGNNANTRTIGANQG